MTSTSDSENTAREHHDERRADRAGQEVRGAPGGQPGPAAGDGADRRADQWVDTDGLREARLALEAALDKKALEPVLLDVRERCSYTNYMLVVSGRSDRQVEAIADGVIEALREQGVRPFGVEGKSSGTWALIDFGDLIAHVFYHPSRESYDLEGLWHEAPRVSIDVPPEARLSAEDAY